MTVERHAIPPGMRLHPLRSKYLTASDIAAAAGEDSYKSALELFLEKTGQKLPAGENALMRRGRWFEAAAIEALRERYPRHRIMRPRVFLTDPETRLGATPDALLEDPEHPDILINCQIKTIAQPVFEKWLGQPPRGYLLQVTAESMLLDAGFGLLAVLVVSTFDAELEIFEVPRHPRAEAEIRKIAAEFWDRIATGRMPAPDYARDAELIRELYPPRKDIPVPLDLTGDNFLPGLLEARETLKAAQKAAVADCDAIEAEIVEKLHGAELALTDGWKITRKMQHRDEYTVQAADFPVMRIARLKEQAA